MHKVSFVGLAVLALFPSFAFAQLGNLESILKALGRLVNLATPIIVGIALLAFFWGLVRYVWGSGGEGEAEGKNIMIAGLVALFIMVSVWGILRLLQNTLFMGDPYSPNVGTPATGNSFNAPRFAE